jgi:CheY-like chemotaxis protein
VFSKEVYMDTLEVLLVENNPADQRRFHEALLQSPVPVQLQVVPDGAAALALLRHEAPYATAAQPDLVFLDLHLPQLHGHSVLQAIRGDPRLKRLPVVAMSSAAEDDEVARSYELGANSYAPKSLDLYAFVAAVQKAVHFWATYALLAPY